jgi:hypothetical protein
MPLVAAARILLALGASAFAAQVSLSGKVTFANGDPLAGATVAVPTSTGQRETQTDNQGNYSFSIEEGSYEHLRVRNMGTAIAGFPRMVEYVAVHPLVVSGATVKDVTMPAFYRFAGRLASPGGYPMPGVAVTIQKWNGSMTELPSDNVVTDSAGRFAVYGMAGQNKVSIPGNQDSGFSSVDLYVTLGKDTVHDVDYTKAPVLSGKVFDADSVPVAGILVAVVKDDKQIEKRTDAQGMFHFSLSTGTVTELRIRAMGDTVSAIPDMLEYTSARNFAIAGDMVKNIVLPRFPRLSGKLRGAADAPIAGAHITVYAWKTGMRQLPNDQAVTDAEGNFALRCQVDSNQLVVTPPDSGVYAQTIKNFTIAKDSSAVVTLTKSAVLTGKVLFAGGAPVPGITLALSNGFEQKETHTASDGTYRFRAQPGKYSDFRVRNMGTVIAGIPKMLEHTVQAGGITLADSSDLVIVLPPFRSMAGKVVNALNAAVPGVTVSGTAWKDGWTQLPSDESVSGGDGGYGLSLPVGTDWIVVRPPQGSLYATAAFTLLIDEALAKDIVLADQAKGIARVQPSVVSQGRSGRLSITGINTHFTDGVTSINLGEGVDVTDITVQSDISLGGSIAVSDGAKPGVRAAKVIGSKETYVGAEIFTVTAPASADLDMDGNGKLKKTVTIEDATGTVLTVDSGTTVHLPPGADTALAFEAPIIKNDSVQPDKAEFLQVQREFFPDGVKFDPPATLAYHYEDQDVKGIDESELRTYKYDNVADTIVAEYKVVGRDTARNILKQEVKGFSLFRIAQNKGGAVKVRAPARAMPARPGITGLSAARVPGSNRLRISFRVEAAPSGAPVRFTLTDMRGARLAEMSAVVLGNGTYSLDWPMASARAAARGMYFLGAEMGGRTLTQPCMPGF